MRQRHVVHWSAGEGAAHTRRKANEREQGSTLRVAQLHRNTHAEQRLRHRQHRQRQRCTRRRMQRCRLSILLLTLLLPRPLYALARSAAHLLRCVAPANVWKPLILRGGQNPQRIPRVGRRRDHPYGKPAVGVVRVVGRRRCGSSSAMRGARESLEVNLRGGCARQEREESA